MTVILAALLLSACAGAQATRTSANTAIIDASAAPACGTMGAARVAARSAAVETIRAGYERYIITGGSSQNNVRTAVIGMQANTFGRISGNTYSGTTTYTPQTVTYGSHDRMLTVIMFNKGDPGYEQALDAKQTLGPDWSDLVKSGIRSCL
ncbi:MULTISPECIES: hypothetical protein [unclassified Chelatococcus]|uniref:hypothetical protein n=1 Tax=unclassified Chelatococcus TaxID=2638111 RepID=UPI0012E17895|nr:MULTISPECIES: hypothetical protein [unclassified Chelatococcus]